MKYSIINYSEAKKHHDFRIDAEFYKPEYLEIDHILKEHKNTNFFSTILLEITGGATPLGADYPKQGIPFLRVQNIMENYYDESNLVFITEKQDEEIKRSKLRKNDVLLTITGAYGKSSVVSENFENANINQHSVLMRFNESINPFYVSTFLNSCFGKKQGDRHVLGVTRPALNYEGIKLFKIPLLSRPFQCQIEALVKKSHTLQQTSKQLYQEAKDLLLEESGLKDWQPKHRLTYTKNYSDTQKAERFDAEYFQPMYEELISRIEEVNNDKLGNIVKYSKGIEVGSEEYIDEGFDFIRVSDFSFKGINNTSKKINKNLFLELKNKFSSKKGDILFTKDGTIGIASLIDKNQDSIISSAFLKLRPRIDIEPEYLTLVLNSVICKKQIEMMSGGAIIDHLKPSDAMKLKIPTLNQQKQKEISLKIIKSKQEDKQSESLLEIAKNSVELAIEKNEEQALKYIENKTKSINS